MPRHSFAHNFLMKTDFALILAPLERAFLSESTDTSFSSARFSVAELWLVKDSHAWLSFAATFRTLCDSIQYVGQSAW